MTMTDMASLERERRQRERYFAEALRAIEAAAGGDAVELAVLIAELRIDIAELMRK